ncbi:hypothetical protein [Propionispira raffinosivorans]|uniref:hypothetical protein n=1 Tax=Propionispira raffinosivorans TaxID=86959 RepID=UPI00068711ED|nr:hypothetical protein [Propionispira raffinosivorans]
MLNSHLLASTVKVVIFLVRKVRSDCTVGTFEKTRGLPPGTVRNPDGRDARSDKKIGTIRKENEDK